MSQELATITANLELPNVAAMIPPSDRQEGCTGGLKHLANSA